MQTHIIQNGVVVNTILASVQEAEAAFPDSVCVDAAAGGAIGWLYDGQAFSPPPPPVKTPEELQAEIVAATQQRLDDFARTRNYDNILSACTYATSSVPKFAAEGQYAVLRRDDTWATLYTILAEVEAGTRAMPTGYADVEPELPVLAWP